MGLAIAPKKAGKVDHPCRQATAQGYRLTNNYSQPQLASNFTRWASLNKPSKPQKHANNISLLSWGFQNTRQLHTFYTHTHTPFTHTRLLCTFLKAISIYQQRSKKPASVWAKCGHVSFCLWVTRERKVKEKEGILVTRHFRDDLTQPPPKGIGYLALMTWPDV